MKMLTDILNQTKLNLFLALTFGMGMTFFIPQFNDFVKGTYVFSSYYIMLLVICITSLLYKTRDFKKTIIAFIDMGIYSSLFVTLMNVIDSFRLGEILSSRNLYIVVFFLILVIINFLLNRTINDDNSNK